MDSELKDYLDGLKREMKEDMAELKREMMEHAEAVETRLLAEFWKWARTADAR